MNPVDVKDNTYIDSTKEVNDKGPKFQVGDHVRISKYKNIFAEGYTPNWSEEVSVISKIKNTVPRTYMRKWWENYLSVLWKRIAKNKSKRICYRKSN